MIETNVELTGLNTFHCKANAKYFSTFSNTDELQDALQSGVITRDALAVFILGGGSNILLTKDINAFVLKNEVRGITVVHEDDDHIFVKVGAGENWHGFVQYCIKNDWAGVENLSLIPGNVGASPIQNIGAYGVEVKEVFESLSALHIREKKVYSFSANDCEFGYRESVFKHKYKDQFVILDVTFRLNKQPVFNTSYGAIEQELARMGTKSPSIAAISQAVINIRSSKLPDPAVIGNAGSFFKNPRITNNELKEIRKHFAGIPTFPLDETSVKVPAAWLIEQCGWKGFRRGDAGCHATQPLVLVNYGNATGKEIFELSGEILLSVRNKFGISLEREVNIV
jgi:UDP-N-acetylmuramate dehydrogenase